MNEILNKKIRRSHFELRSPVKLAEYNKTMRLNSKKMFHDILIRLNTINKPQKHLSEKLGISRSTLWRLGKGKEITVNTFLILAQWLGEDINEYITYDRQ